MDVQKHDLCRLCLRSINGCDEILLNNHHHLIKSILLITGLEVVSNPGQFEYLCSQCQPLLEQCVEFRKTCISNDGVFREIMTNLNHVEDCQSELFGTVDECIKQEPVDMGEPAQSLNDELILRETMTGSNYEADSKSELKQSVDEYIKQEPGDLEDLATSPNVELGNDHEVVEPSEEHNGAGLEPLKDTRSFSLKLVRCLKCKKVLESSKIDEHRKTHQKILRCPHCPRVFVGAEVLGQHISVKHTDVIQHNCDQCGKLYTSRRSYNEHLRVVHSEEKRYACTVCGERFGRASTRWYHQRTAHSTLRPFSCELCDKTFKTKSHLTDHVRHHMGYRRNRKKQ